jgi:succinate-semialdehyde dehydrogenase/glutarate-semialdehyde dehydrogenase
MNATAAAPPRGLHIGDDERPAGDGVTFAVLNPADGSAIAEVASATADDARAAVDAAAAAGPRWAARAPRERSEILRRAFELMTEGADTIARLIVRENGKPLTDARGEVAYAAEFFRWYAEEAVRNVGSVTTAPSGTNRIVVHHQPVGVCVLVTPWNFPAAMATRKIGPALAAGCSVVLKPASDTPLTALLIGDLLEEAGVPPGVVNVLPSRRSGEVVAAMVDDPRVRKLSFTGSTEVGRELLALAARSVVNTSMELGGNAPFIVLADADLDAAVEGALVAKMRNMGEACTAANRFYVQAPVAAAFTERLAAAMGSLRAGPGLVPGVQVGPLINEAAREKIDELVADAVDRGARVETGGSRLGGPGFFYRPTVLSGVAGGSAILSEEIFGPVAPIVAFDDVEDAVRQANDTEYGLVSYVYTQDLRRGLEIGDALEAGMIGLNRGLVSDPAAPFGGVKQSGIGREGGHEGLLDYTEAKYFAIG